jgi:hypothetical protein
MNNELGWIWKWPLSIPTFAWMYWGKPRKTSFRIAGLLASIGTQDLSNVCIYFHGYLRNEVFGASNIYFLVSNWQKRRQMQTLYLILGHDRFLPQPFQFVIHLSSSHSTLYSLSYWESVVKWTIYKINIFTVSETNLVSNNLFNETWSLFSKKWETFWASIMMVNILNNLFTFRNVVHT